MKRNCCSLCLIAGLSLLAVSTSAYPQGKGGDKKKPQQGEVSPGASAGDGTVKDWGMPVIKDGKATAFWLWQDNDRWHLKTTGDKKLHKFTGRIDIVGGQILEVKGSKGEAKGAHPDYYRFSHTRLEFEFDTSKGDDGVNFIVDKAAKELKILITIDGGGDPSQIHLGKASVHPQKMAFAIPAHPGAEPAKSEPAKLKK